MSNYNSLKTTIDANIKQNGVQAITGQILNSVLNAMVNTLGTGYSFAGVATTATNPGSPDAKVFYIANGKGTYTNFGGIQVTEDDVVVLYWDSSWHKVSTGIASQEKLSGLIDQINGTELIVPSQVSNGYLLANGDWVTTYDLHHVVINVSNYRGQKVTTGNVIQYGFLKNYVFGGHCDWSDTIGRTTGQPTNVEIPNDAVFLYLYLAGSIIVPSISGLVDKEGLLKEVDKINDRLYHNKSIGQPTLGDGYLSSTGGWTRSDSLHHVICDISLLKGQKVSTGNAIQYGFLKTYSIENTCEWATGGRQSGYPTNVTIPNDANYLYLYIAGETNIPTIEVTGQYMSIIDNLTMLNNLISSANKVFAEKTATSLIVYVSVGNGRYVGFPLEYRYKAFAENVYPCFYDNWGIGRLALYDFTGGGMSFNSFLYYPSETEIAIGTGLSFSGGSAHGFENIVDGENGREILFMINGQKIDEQDSFELKSINSIEVHQHTDLYTAYSNTNKVGEIIKNWVFSDKGCELSVKLTFTSAISYGVGYIGMMGVYRHLGGDSSKGYLTDKAIKGNDPYKTYNITDGWRDQTENMPLYMPDINCKEINAFSDFGLGFRMVVKESSASSPGCGMFITSNNNPYNKIYNMVSNGGTSSIGQVISSKVIMSVE